MTIKTNYLTELNIVVHVGSDVVTASDILVAARAWEKHADFDAAASMVWDLVAADFAVDWEKIKEDGPQIAERYRAKPERTGRMAWVVGDELTGIVVDSIHLAFPWPREWRVFNDAVAAIEWLRIAPDKNE